TVTPPSIQVSDTTVGELDYVFLFCFSKNIRISILWLFNGQRLGLTNRMKLYQNNSTLYINPVRREDSGDYQCEVSNPVSSKRSDPIHLEIISSPFTAQVTVEAVPPYVAEGQSVLLRVNNLPATASYFQWYKGEAMVERNKIAVFILFNNTNETGLAYSSRERIYPNGSLLFQNVTQKDAGAYTLSIVLEIFGIRSASVQIRPLPPRPKTLLKQIPPHVGEGKNVLLLVHNLPETVRVFYWHKGKTLVERNKIAGFLMSRNTNETGPAYSGRKTIYPNGSLLFQNVTQKDAGAYMLHMIMENIKIRTTSLQFTVHSKWGAHAHLRTSEINL
ncbi:hypothetical protein A6R68_01324, partial [Neotoma lepida]